MLFSKPRYHKNKSSNLCIELRQKKETGRNSLFNRKKNINVNGNGNGNGGGENKSLFSSKKNSASLKLKISNSNKLFINSAISNTGNNSIHMINNGDENGNNNTNNSNINSENINSKLSENTIYFRNNGGNGYNTNNNNNNNNGSGGRGSLINFGSGSPSLEKESRYNSSPSLGIHITKKQLVESLKGTYSLITDNIYMGDKEVAKNFDILKELKITHIINCAGLVIPNHFEGDFIYKTLELSDVGNENIFCLFYEVIDFIENALNNNGRILIHCKCGISRSAAMAICYLMYSQNLTYEEALRDIKYKRPSCEPNASYAIALLNWDNHRKKKREYTKLYNISNLSEKSDSIIPKLLNPPFTRNLLFLSVACLIFHSPFIIYVWIGENCIQDYVDAALLFVEQLQQYEAAVCNVQLVYQSKESEQFLELLHDPSKWETSDLPLS
eukprot:TRINITY_DN525_c1_g1_i1.p1 TRINITY_DN525_c1_g1~~TRINITY_DN525_c1_g1_i1.p1  ORF type:complete len:443 (+),score=98.17 TRINITY_DN525_c1_g1_i1:79-1407(+)